MPNERLRRNAASKAKAEHDREPWSADELDWLHSWTPGDEGYLAELAELLGRTIEACREKFYKSRRAGFSVSYTRTVSHPDGTTVSSRTEYRGWMEGMGDE